jgi:hypothetical protein
MSAFGNFILNQEYTDLATRGGILSCGSAVCSTENGFALFCPWRIGAIQKQNGRGPPPRMSTPRFNRGEAGAGAGMSRAWTRPSP